MANETKKMGWLRYALSFVEGPFKAVLSFILNLVDRIIFLIMFKLKGKTYLPHDLRGDLDDSLLAAPYLPMEGASEIVST